MLYSKIMESEIKEIIESNEFNDFKSNIEQVLNINKEKYEIQIENNFATDREGYPKEEVNASTTMPDEEGNIKIIFYLKGLERNIDMKFFRLSTNRCEFYILVKIFIKNALTHELFHVHQILNLGLTKEQVKEQKDKFSYNERDYEIEAMSNAKKIMNNYGGYKKQLLDYIDSTKRIDNDNIQEVIKLIKELEPPYKKI